MFDRQYYCFFCMILPSPWPLLLFLYPSTIHLSYLTLHDNKCENLTSEFAMVEILRNLYMTVPHRQLCPYSGTDDRIRHDYTSAKISIERFPRINSNRPRFETIDSSKHKHSIGNAYFFSSKKKKKNSSIL